MIIHAVRHSKPIGIDGRCYGQSDVICCPKHFESTVRYLSQTLPKHLPIYTSPLGRCSRLAMCLAPLLMSPTVIIEPLLMERHFGDWEMRTWAEIGKEAVDAWVEAGLNFKPPNGESTTELCHRTAQFIRLRQQEQLTCAIVITHGGIMRCLLNLLQPNHTKLFMQESMVFGAVHSYTFPSD